MGSAYRTDAVGGVFLRTTSTPKAFCASWSSKVAALYTYSCFFFCGMCLTYPWNAINAAVGALSEALGKSAYVYIQAAYYLPLLPCLLLQTKCDARCVLTRQVVLCFPLLLKTSDTRNYWLD